MKFYTIAIESSVCHGHGDYGTEHKIVRMGFYGSDGFPPLFKTEEDAMEFVTNSKAFYSRVAIVTLETYG